MSYRSAADGHDRLTGPVELSLKKLAGDPVGMGGDEQGDRTRWNTWECSTVNDEDVTQTIDLTGWQAPGRSFGRIGHGKGPSEMPSTQSVSAEEIAKYLIKWDGDHAKCAPVTAHGSADGLGKSDSLDTIRRGPFFDADTMNRVGVGRSRGGATYHRDPAKSRMGAAKGEVEESTKQPD